MDNWIQHCYSRLLIDNHISEDDPGFMTCFDPQAYVAMVKKAGVEASMVYACDHNGNCYYPSQVGHMHRNLNGRDIFGETVNLLRKEGVVPIAYYTTIFHNHSAKNHPSWRMQDIAGKQHSGRYWWSCPNSQEYLDFTLAQVGEVIAYAVDGIFIDMTFWPVVCYCPNCRGKFRRRTGREMPETLDWSDPHWIDFQRFRETSMVEFCQVIAGSIKARKDITVTFQNSPIIFGWGWGQTPGIANACDYVSGDFYGGKYQHILGAKILSAVTKNQPFEYMTSRCVDLRDHTSMKSEAELRCEAATTLINGGAYFFIDAINPDGTLTEAVYERLGRVSASLAPFAARIKAHRPVLDADTGLYFSMASFINPAQDRTPVRELRDAGTSTPPYEEMLGASIVLTRLHRPFIVTRDAEGDLGRLKTLIINNAQIMSEQEVQRVRQFVANGGTLLATGLTSSRNPDGSPAADFALADVFGVSYAGRMTGRVNFLALPGENNYVLSDRPAPCVRLNGAHQLAGLVEPHFDPDNPERYASIHSNPPGRLTEYPGLTLHSYGKGRCLYLAADIFHLQQDAQQVFAAWLLQSYAPGGLVLDTNAPPAVEISLLRSTTQDAILVGFVNYQKELPNIPVYGIQVEFALEGREPKACTLLSNGQDLPFTRSNGCVRFEIPALETIEMVEIMLELPRL